MTTFKAKYSGGPQALTGLDKVRNPDRNSFFISNRKKLFFDPNAESWGGFDRNIPGSVDPEGSDAADMRILAKNQRLKKWQERAGAGKGSDAFSSVCI